MQVHGPEQEGKRKHTPVVEAPKEVKSGEWFDVRVIVGKDIAHPNTKEHWIEYVELWAGDFLVARADLQPERAASEVVFRVRLEEPVGLKAYAYCNLHGLWQSEEVKVETK